MASTTENQGLTIPTIGTNHAGKTTGPTDVCKKVNNVPTPYPNTAPTSRAVQTTTAKTVIKGKEVITLETRFGTPSDDAHDGVFGGVKSGTYRLHAQVTKAAPDLRTENVPPARHTDPTNQNSANTVGILIDTTLSMEEQLKAADLLKRCQVIELTATDDKRVMVKGLLEVVQGSTVELVSTRKNATAAQGSAAFNTPVCAPPPNGFTKTRFHLIRTGGDVFALPWKQQTIDGVDKYTLDSAWTGDPPPAPAAAPNQELKLASNMSPKNGVLPTASDGKPAAFDQSKNTLRTSGASGIAAEQAYREGEIARRNTAAPAIEGPPPRTPEEAQKRADVQEAYRRQAAEEAAQQKRMEVYQKTRDDLEAAKKSFEASARKERAIYSSFDILKKLWQLQPTAINITAQGCSGVQTGVVKVYPPGQKEFDLLTPFKAAFQTIEKIVQPFDELCKTLKKGGSGWSFKIELFTKAMVKMQIEWKELTKPTIDNELQAHHCNTDWLMIIGFEKMVGFTADFSVSVLMIVGGALGRIAAAILERINVAIDLGIKADLSIGLTVLFGRNEYKEPKPKQLTCPMVAQFSLYIIFRAGTLGSATASVNLKFETAWDDTRITPSCRMVKAELHWAQTKISLTWKATIQANVIGLKDGKSFEGNLIEPIVYDPTWMTAFPLGG